MTGSELRNTEREQFLPIITPGSARFIAAADRNIAVKRFYNPKPLHFEETGEDASTREAIAKARYHTVDMGLVNKLSTGLREVTTQREAQQGKSTQDQLRDWAEQMVIFLQTLGKTASPALKTLAAENLGIDLDQTDPRVLWQQTQTLWETYLAKGSDIQHFFQDIMADIPNRFPKTIEEMQRRIELVRPLLGIFGDERIEILAADAENARVLLEGGVTIKKDVGELALAALQQDFTTERAKQAYALLWEAIKDQIPAESPPQGETGKKEKVLDTEEKKEEKPTTPPPEPSPPAPSTSPNTQRGKIPPPQPQTAEQKKEQKPPDQSQAQQISQTIRPQIADRPSATPRQESANQQQKERSESSVLTASVVARNPERPWIASDAVFTEKVGDGFALGAFDGLENGGVYSAAVSGKLKHLFVKRFRSMQQPPRLDTALLQTIHLLEDGESFARDVKKGADNELRRLKAGKGEAKRVTDDIGSTGLIAFAAKDGDRNVLATINLGSSRLVAFDPQSGSVEQLTADGTLAQRKLRIGQVSSADEAFVDYQRNYLSRSVRPSAIAELQQRFDEQLLNGWSQTDEILRVFPLKPQTLYLVLTNGITLNIPPRELPGVLQRAYTMAQRQDGIDMKKMMQDIVGEAQKRMKHPQQYQITVRGKAQQYTVVDDAAVAGVMFRKRLLLE